LRGSTRILTILALTNLVSYAARNALFAVYPDLHAQFGIDDAQIGLLQTVFMIPHAAATLPFGSAGDRYDRRRVIMLGMALASVAGAAGALGHSYSGLAVSRACPRPVGSSCSGTPASGTTLRTLTPTPAAA